MLVLTTPNIEGKKITQYVGLVTGEAILGANVFRDMFAGIRDIVGGRSGSYEKVLGSAREMALREMQEKAAELGASSAIRLLPFPFPLGSTPRSTSMKVNGVPLTPPSKLSQPAGPRPTGLGTTCRPARSPSTG